MQKKLTPFRVAMMNVAIVASLQMMMPCATYGYSLIFFYLLATCFFFIPCILLVSELATQYPITGGAYIWVKMAFGAPLGFFTVALQWLCNLIWYTTIFSLIATIFTALLFPHLASQSSLIIGFATLFFWIITLLNCLGISVSSFVSTLCAIFGVILPTLILIVCGALWLSNGFESHLSGSFFPDLHNFSNVAFLTQVVISLSGIEMAAVHAGDMQNPKRTIPLAFLIAAPLALAIVVAAPLCLGIVIPNGSLHIISGLVDGLALFFSGLNISKTVFTIMLALVFIGNIGCVTAWMISSTRALFVASGECKMPAFFQMTNRFSAPKGILILEAIIFSLVSLVFLFFSLENSYWLLLELASQLALIYYLLIFFAAFKLKRTLATNRDGFTIPGGASGTFVVALIAAITALGAVIVGFFPPASGAVQEGLSYSLMLLFGIACALLFPLLLFKLAKQSTRCG